MIAESRDAFICDLAEVYHIYDYHSVPVRMLGTLCSGLGPDSRVGMKRAKRYAPRDTVLLAMIADELNDLRWGLLTDGNNENPRPERIAPLLYEHNEEEQDEVISYDSGESFEEARARIIEKVKDS